MGIFSTLLGSRNDRTSERRPAGQPAPVASPRATVAPAASADEQALARYRYLLRTAPPEDIEQVHTEAFARLTPAQRAQALNEIAAAVPGHERSALLSGQGDPRALARVATRAEIREPGFLERTLGGGGGMSTGAMIGTSLLGSFVASLAGSLLAQRLMGGFHGLGGFVTDGNYDGFASYPSEGLYDGAYDTGTTLPAPPGTGDDYEPPEDTWQDDSDPSDLDTDPGDFGSEDVDDPVDAGSDDGGSSDDGA
jgi:hypothetical protein